jgi:hypothetical protein
MCQLVPTTWLADTAVRWLVAVEIGRRLGNSYRLSEWAPKGGFYDCLPLHTEPVSDRPAVAVSRGGQLVVSDGHEAVPVAENPWPRVARGEWWVTALADQVLMVLAAHGCQNRSGR